MMPNGNRARTPDLTESEIQDLPLLDRPDNEESRYNKPMFDLVFDDSDSEYEDDEERRRKRKLQEEIKGEIELEEEKQKKMKQKEEIKDEPVEPSRAPPACEECVAVGRACDDLETCAWCIISGAQCVREPSQNPQRILALQLGKIVYNQECLEILVDSLARTVRYMSSMNDKLATQSPSYNGASGHNHGGPFYFTNNQAPHHDTSNQCRPNGCYNAHASSSTSPSSPQGYQGVSPGTNDLNTNGNSFSPNNPRINRLPGEPSDADLRLSWREGAYNRRTFSHIPRHRIQHLLRFTDLLILQSGRWRNESMDQAQAQAEAQEPPTTAAIEIEIRTGRRHGSTLKIHLGHDIGEIMADVFGMARVA